VPGGDNFVRGDGNNFENEINVINLSFKKTREKMIFLQQWTNFFPVTEFCPYTVKKVSHIPVPSQDVTNQALSGRE
jgi:hypothetical protein